MYIMCPHGGDGGGQVHRVASLLGELYAMSDEQLADLIAASGAVERDRA